MSQPRIRAALVKLVLDGEAGEKANKYSTNDLVSAIKTSNYVLVENLLNLGHNPNVHVGNNSTTPLLCAISVGSIEIVRLLVHRGANIDAQDDKGNTPLLSAYCIGQYAIVKFLLACGADPTKRNNSGLSFANHPDRGYAPIKLL